MTLDLTELYAVIEIAMDEEIEPFGLDDDFYEDIGMDSMGAVAMIVEIQRRFRIRIPEADVPELRTPRLLIDAFSRLQQAASEMSGGS